MLLFFVVCFAELLNVFIAGLHHLLVALFALGTLSFELLFFGFALRRELVNICLNTSAHRLFVAFVCAADAFDICLAGAAFMMFAGMVALFSDGGRKCDQCREREISIRFM